jgi:halimadienyl-diphosphate synthase
MDLEAEARELVRNLGGRLGPSPYDIAWMARVPADGGGAVRWPDLVDWLIEHQWSDGSWGGAIRYYHDRFLCTLAAMIALKEHGQSRTAEEAIERGERYIWHNLHRLRHDPKELVGFELIFPTLLTQARALGLNVPTNTCGYGRVRAEKLRLLPEELLYSRDTSTAFSLEFLDVKADPDRLCRLQGPNGSVANSPAATAYLVLQAGGSRRALEYLEEAKALPKGVPAFYPFRTFETAWVLEHLAFGGLPLDTLVEPSIWEDLRASLSEEGVSMDPAFDIKDGDTTAVTLHVLALGGQMVDPMILHHFEKPGGRTFCTLHFERNASASTNAHALGALSLMPDYSHRQEVWDKVVAQLLADRVFDTYWVDKWHASPYYATSHVLITLISAQEPSLTDCLSSIEWLLHTQRDDGSWGCFDEGTAEETAYALLALLHCHRQVSAVDAEVLKRGVSYLCLSIDLEAGAYPELWIAKSLYAPESIVRAAILAAINLYQDTLGYISD